MMQMFQGVFSLRVSAVLEKMCIRDSWTALPRLRRACGDRAVLRTVHYFEENARTLAQRAALAAGDFAAFARLVEKSGHSSFEC